MAGSSIQNMVETKMTFRAMKTVIRCLYGNLGARILISVNIPVRIICSEPDHINISRLFVCMRGINLDQHNK